MALAVPLGRGETIEAQRTGAERFGGIQLVVYEPRPGRFPDEAPPPRQLREVVGELTVAAGDPGRARTFNPEIKSLLLYH